MQRNISLSVKAELHHQVKRIWKSNRALTFFPLGTMILLQKPSE